MPKWIHERAEHLLAKNPSMPKGEAFAIATQQSHALGKSPKGYGTAKGKRVAKHKFDTPRDDVKSPNPGNLETPKLKAAMFHSFVEKVAFEYSNNDFSSAQYAGYSIEGSGPARQVSYLPPRVRPSLRAPLEKRALLERLVRLGATDVPHTPRMVMRQRSPEELASLQHTVQQGFDTLQKPVQNAADSLVSHVPNLTARKVLNYATRTAIENPEVLPMQAVPIPGLTEGYLALKKGLERGIDFLSPVPKTAGLGEVLTTDLGGPSIFPGLNDAIHKATRYSAPAAKLPLRKAPLSSAPHPMFAPRGPTQRMSSEEIMAHLEKQKIRPKTAMAYALEHLKVAFQASQYNGPASGGPFPMVSSVPPFTVQDLGSAVQKPKAAAMTKESLAWAKLASITSELRMPQNPISSTLKSPPSVKVPSMKGPAVPKPVKGPPGVGSTPTISQIASPKPVNIEAGNTGLKMTPLPGTKTTHI